MTRPVAIVTGVGRRVGIATGIARRLATDGWDVGFSFWRGHDARFGAGADEALEIAEALRSLGAQVSAHEVEFADAEAVVAFAAAVAADLGAPSALVLAHAEGVDSDVASTTVESFDRHHDVNARAAWLLIREFAAGRPTELGEDRSLGNGAVVALTSDHVSFNLPYGASKGSLDRIVLGAAGELAGRGIRANIVNPGPIDTGWMDDGIREALLPAQPTGRLGTPADTAELVAFLVSPASAWITGQLIKSNGGFSL